jgi:hypothetical protein
MSRKGRRGLPCGPAHDFGHQTAVRCDLEGSSRELRPIAQRKLPDIDALIARAELVESWLRAAADCKRPSLTILEG